MKVQRATSKGLEMLRESRPSKEVLTLKSLQAFEVAANGKATKIIIPSQIQGIAGLASGITEVIKSEESGNSECDKEA